MSLMVHSIYGATLQQILRHHLLSLSLFTLITWYSTIKKRIKNKVKQQDELKHTQNEQNKN